MFLRKKWLRCSKKFFLGFYNLFLTFAGAKFIIRLCKGQRLSRNLIFYAVVLYAKEITVVFQ